MFSERTIRYVNRQKLFDSIKKKERNIKMKQIQPKINWLNMVSASSIRNFMLDDPCIDYYKYYNIGQNLTDDIHTEYILKNGIQFEKDEMIEIKKKHVVVKVAEHTDSRNKAKFNETIQLMKKGVPIIYQGVLHDYENKTYGLPDLLVRSDYINTLMGYEVITDEEARIVSPKLNTLWHYKVIDIKCSTIPLKVDGIHVSNSDGMPVYKGQLYIYTMALNKVMGLDLKKGFIWGRRYDTGGDMIHNNMNKLGVVIYEDSLITKVYDACKWLRDMRKEGYKWQLLPTPSRTELYPNMKNHKDGKWNQVKKIYSNMYNEITSVWNCSYESRMNAHKKGIYSYMDPKCTATAMGFNDTKIASTIDMILDINRQNVDIIRPSKIMYDRSNWITENENTLAAYLDYETIMTKDNKSYIFMIGIGYELNKKWMYKNFTMMQLNDISEKNIFDNFNSYVSQILTKMNKQCIKYYHWSCAEPVQYRKFINKIANQIVPINNISKFYDLSKVFICEPIVIKGAFTYSLKSIAKALYNMGLINTVWSTDSACSNGLNAMVLALELYNNLDVNQLIVDNSIMKEIISYNEVDCKTMYEILSLIQQF